jgi:enoyl-CoA hydratase
MAAETLVRVDCRAGGVGVLTLSRPDQLNALSTAMAEQLEKGVAALAADPAIRVMVVAGEGKAFCAGADIAEFGALGSPAAFSAFLARLTRPLRLLADCPKPSVAALHGVALGGGLELALSCDLRVADEGTQLGLPEIKLGLLPGATGTARLPREVPAAVARHMLLTGEPMMATDAHRLGLMASVVPPGQALEAALALAGRLAVLSPPALSAAKQLLAAGPSLSLEEAVQQERRSVADLFGTEEARQGIAAFLERRAR